MNRSSASKATANRRKGPIRVKHVQSNDPLPEDFLSFLSALPPDSSFLNATEHAEPVKKRARVQDVETIPIARETLTLDRPIQSNVPIAEPMSRTNVHHCLKLNYDEVSHILTISSKPSKGRPVHGAFKSELELGRLQFIKSTLVVLKVLSRTRDVDSDEGALWVRVAIDLERKDEDHLQLSLELIWNSSSMQPLRNSFQRALSQQVLDTFFKNDRQVLDSASENERLSPRAFYDAAFTPEKDHAGFSSLSVPGLSSSLFPFQRRALQWLLNREGVRWSDRKTDGASGLEPLPPSSTTDLPPSFSATKDADSKLVYVSHLYHIVTRDPTSFSRNETDVKGGILAEEMGLGKTVEMISLICMHVRDNLSSLNDDAMRNKRLSGATLIITPPTLKSQWVSEFGKHAPHLRVMVYEGLKGLHEDEDEDELVSELAKHDVVIATYTVLQAEIHHAQELPNRSMRHGRKYQRYNSPLTQISWWRVCLDEAQQIDSGVSNAAKVARLIPRVNAWGITGTPVKEDIKDLWGLLFFLRYEPFASSTTIWEGLITSHKDLFYPLFNHISLRHTKRLVRDELTLPPQKRYVITMPFTAVEEQHYQTQFKELVNRAGLGETGAPMQEDWDPEDPNTIDCMKRVLAQLRQSILHPSLGSSRLLRMGDQKGKPLRTVDEVLDAMIEQSESSMKTDQRALLLSKLERGQILANTSALDEAIAIWQEVLDEVVTTEEECRKQLQVEIEKAKQASPHADLEDAKSSDSQSEDPDGENVSSRVGECRRHLRSILDLHHRALFFLASAHFQLKSDVQNVDPNSDKFKSLEEKEVSGYENAKMIRKEILHEARGKALTLIGRIRDKATSQSFVEIPEIKWDSFHGIESLRILRTFEALGDSLNRQAELVDEWRESIIQLLLRPLVDDDEAETTGEEYADSTKIQDDLMVYTLALRSVIADRHCALSGLENERVKYETRGAERQAENKIGHAPQTVLELLQRRERLKPGPQGSSFRSIISELRELSSKLRSEVGLGNNRAKVELDIVEKQLRLAQEQSSAQTKAVTGLERELDAFTTAMNARVVYYRQLQAVSDTVDPLNMEEVGNVYWALKGLLANEQVLQKKIAVARPNHRYLLHLKERGADADICIICQCPFTLGVLTICGHQFCKECITLWLKARHSCPLCKKLLTTANLHDITLKKKELRIRQEDLHAPDSSQGSTSKSKGFGIYSQFSSDKLEAIKSIDLHGPSFATKIDTLARHLLWLRVEDPGAKSVIFSQFGGFFDILSRAFDQYAIGYTSFKMKDGIKKFKEDPIIECFLMDARSHASGLNLVNASHVFLCEPLLNTALELQAIARVDRIGQEHETTVWLYLIDGTVEESIYNLSVQRRLEHLGKNAKGKSKESTPEVSDLNLEAANSLELEEAGTVSKLMSRDQTLGEVVDNNDLWQCLFGHLAKATASTDNRLRDPNVMRFLSGEAAEERRTT
ncbi:SNF2 family N-terminal domain-containing protein [Hypoxylon cercidicola]|nr:SNF2 family N-terminal domain-containing protein [Hypoxylon cercidicola]